MTFPFNLTAAVGQIVALEAAIATPSPGVTTVYGFNANPAEITNPALLPAIVHINRGPLTLSGDGAVAGLSAVRGVYQLAYDVESVALIIEATPDQFPSDEGAANLFWKSIAETFFSYTNAVALATAAGAHTYSCILGTPSYGLRAWPPIEPVIRMYYAFTYTHRFIFMGG
jgi:hypothetical protein